MSESDQPKKKAKKTEKSSEETKMEVSDASVETPATSKADDNAEPPSKTTGSAKPQRRQREPRQLLDLSAIFIGILSLFKLNLSGGINGQIVEALRCTAWLIRRKRGVTKEEKVDKEKVLSDGTRVTTTQVLAVITAIAGPEAKGNQLWYQTRETLAEFLVHNRNIKSFAGLKEGEAKGKNAAFMPNILPLWVGDKIPGSCPPPKGKVPKGVRRRARITGHRMLNPLARAFNIKVKGGLVLPKGNKHYQRAFAYACFGNVVSPLGAIKFEITNVDGKYDVANLLEVPVRSNRRDPGVTIDMWGILATTKGNEKGVNTYYVKTPNGILAKKQMLNSKGKGLGYDQFSIYGRLQETFSKMTADQPDESDDDQDAL